CEVGNPDRFDWNILVAANAGVDRNDVVLAFKLKAVARQIDEGHRLRTRRRYFVEELTNRPAQRVLVKVARTNDVETGCPQRLGDEPGIVGRRRQPAGLVFAVTDYECEAPLRRLRVDWRHKQWRQHGQQGRNAVQK